jgi:hypothetical protein
MITQLLATNLSSSSPYPFSLDYIIVASGSGATGDPSGADPSFTRYNGAGGNVMQGTTLVNQSNLFNVVIGAAAELNVASNPSSFDSIVASGTRSSSVSTWAGVVSGLHPNYGGGGLAETTSFGCTMRDRMRGNCGEGRTNLIYYGGAASMSGVVYLRHLTNSQLIISAPQATITTDATHTIYQYISGGTFAS